MATSQTQVCVRVRPLDQREKSEEACIDCLTDAKVACFTSDTGDANVFPFDFTLDEAASQSDVYDVVEPVIQGVLQGIHGTILAYGQTGSGKTHTLFGDLENEAECGIVPRAARQLMDVLAREDRFASVCITLSAAEIYCERIFDLLEPSNCDLQIKEDVTRGIHIAGLVQMTVSNERELHQTVQRGMANRTVPFGKLCMVDLAGSERQDKTGTSGVQLDEGILINKSLSALANVIACLTESKARHVPYRESKLTRVLQDSLGGQGRTMLMRSRPKSVEQQLNECQEECKQLKMQLEQAKNKNAGETLSPVGGVVRSCKRAHEYKKRVFLFLAHFMGLMLIFSLEDFWFPR